MALLKQFSKVLSFLKKNRNHPFIQYQLKRSGLSVDDIKDYEDFKKIKIIGRKDLADLSKDIDSYLKLFEVCPHKIFESPGGIFNFLFDKYCQYRFYKALEISSFGACDVVINTFAYHLTPAGEMFEEAAEKIGATVIPVGPVSSEKCADLVVRTKATAFIGTKTFLKKVLENLGDRNSLLKAYLIAEKITEEERKELAEKYNIEIYQGYGTAEVGLIATECEYKDGMHIDDELFVEFLSVDHTENVKEGELGEVIVTLLNEKFPLIRYGTGDLSKYILSECKCERESIRILGIFGRTDSSVKVKGVFIHKWQFDEFCSANSIAGRLEVNSDEEKFDYLILRVNSNVKDIHKKFKDVFKVSLKDVIIDEKIKENEIIDNREYLKKR
ncbi:phenylacetate--CoA ligase [Deferribacter autotrophicus]|uniref:Phenylacetate--CoA ligase n=1 Tax=Deferribacter autotrophicus TaxID=500465 RepID=A0A5A8F940_9BACT|nr:AMP-binding protein [Deferribacter autotrophicus]KAA0259432.1 phenylacetate--CoA ligase [Deferribacter autotrophicus]